MGQTYYWKGAGADHAWETVTGNWFYNSALTTQASDWPGHVLSTDQVHITSSFSTSYPAAPIAPITLAVFDAASQTGPALDMTADTWTNMTVTGGYIAVGNLAADGFKYKDSGSSVVATADFYGNAVVDSNITATLATFHNASSPAATITATTVFNDTASMGSAGTINGISTFNASSHAIAGTLNGNCHINSSPSNWSGTTATFSGDFVYVNSPGGTLDLSAATISGSLILLSNSSVMVIAPASAVVGIDPAAMPNANVVKGGVAFNGGLSTGTASASNMGPWPITAKSIGPWPIYAKSIGPWPIQ